MRGFGLAAAAAVIAIGVLLFPSVRQEDVKALTAKEQIAIVGNSVIRTASKCDTDGRGIGEMLAERMGQPVADMSLGGQSLDQSIELAALALRNSNIRAVVVPLIVTSRLVEDSFDLQTWLFYRTASRDVPPMPLSHRVSQKRFFEGDSPPNGVGFSYQGTAYPDYNGIKTIYFSKEHDAMPCPENWGSNLKFIEAYYNFVYRSPGMSAGLMQRVEMLQADAKRRGKVVVFLMMPVNMDLLDRQLADVGTEVRSRAAAVAFKLRSEGATVVDLTTTTRAPLFADAWCACGHLQQVGRMRVAQTAAEALAVQLDAIKLQVSR